MLGKTLPFLLKILAWGVRQGVEEFGLGRGTR
jgi:hypothetical protein